MKGIKTDYSLLRTKVLRAGGTKKKGWDCGNNQPMAESSHKGSIGILKYQRSIAQQKPWWPKKSSAQKPTKWVNKEQTVGGGAVTTRERRGSQYQGKGDESRRKLGGGKDRGRG